MPARKRASAGKTPGKLSPAAANRLADKILKDVQPILEEAEARKQTVSVLPKPDLIRKLRGQTSHSPLFRCSAWNTVAPRGTTTRRVSACSIQTRTHNRP